MLLNRQNYIRKNIYYIIIFLMVFSAGLMNSVPYFNFIGLSELSLVIRICFYISLLLLFFLFIINKLMNREIILPNTFPYWILLLFAVLFKFFILFIQNPLWIFPGGRYSSELFHFITILLAMILITSIIKNIYGVKIAIWGLGLGAAFSGFIPFLFFPEMIGSRATEVQGSFFTGGFWNSAVISYISVGWLLVSLSSIEKSKIKSTFLISLFLIIAFGGLAGLSRATLLSVTVSVTVYLIFTNKFKKYIKVILSLSIGVLLVINLFPELVLNFSGRLDGGIDVENESRTRIWLGYLESLPNYLLFGEIDGNYKRFGFGPHSVLLNWLVQFGIFGLLGFVILICGLIYSTIKVRKQFSIEVSSALIAWIAAYLSVSLINETGFKHLTVFIAFGIILAWGNISKENVN